MTTKQKIIQLLQTGTLENIRLALNLEKSQKVDLADFWQACIELFFGLKSELTAEDLVYLFSTPQLDWAHIALHHQNPSRYRVEQPSLLAPVEPLDNLPEGLTYLGQLEKVFLSGNNLTELPDFIGNWTELKELHLSNNRLTEIPWAVAELKKLERLDLSGNPVQYLPRGLKKLSNLKELCLEFTPLSADQVEDLRNALPETVIYYAPSCF